MHVYVILIIKSRYSLLVLHHSNSEVAATRFDTVIYNLRSCAYHKKFYIMLGMRFAGEDFNTRNKVKLEAGGRSLGI